MTPRPAISRTRILAAAETVVRERGYARATTKEIARAAGCSEGTLYNHFADKEELFVVCSVERNPEVFETITGLVDRAGQEPIASILGDVLRVVADLHAQLVPMLTSVWADPELMARHKEFVHAHLPAEMQRGPIPLIAAYLEAEQTLGRLRAELDPTAIATMLMSIATSYALWDHTGFARDLTPDRGRYFADAVQVLVDGLAPPLPAATATPTSAVSPRIAPTVATKPTRSPRKR